jgi:hypothetical protein
LSRSRALALAILLAACAAQPPLPAPAPSVTEAEDPRPRIRIADPLEDGSVVRGPAALVEISGAAFGPGSGRHALVLALDQSPSVFTPTGRDIDGDGVVAQWSGGGAWQGPVEGWTTDFDDTVAAAELRSARVLLERLGAESRVGLVSFHGRAKPLLALTGPADALGALAALRLESSGVGTNCAAALREAARLLASAEPGATRTILLLSDGYPNQPGSKARAEEKVLEAADELGAAGIRVHTLVIESLAPPSPVFDELARRTRGSFHVIDDARDLPLALSSTQLSEIASVAVSNLTTGKPGLAVRILPDGRFDAFVPLAAGANRIEVRATTRDGLVATAERSVVYEATGAAGGAAALAAEQLLRSLRERSVELELSAELRRRQQTRKQLRIEAESR